MPCELESRRHKGSLIFRLILVATTQLDKARYEAEYCFFENLVNMVNAENMVNVVNIIKAQEEKMKVIYEFSKTR